MNWQLRTARASDLAAIMALETPTFGTDAWSAVTMAAEIADANTHYLLAFAPDTPELIEGYAGLLAPRGAFESDIQTIAVAPFARGRGLGRVLMQTLVVEARKRGAREVFLEVRADNPGARHLYERLGFVEIGVRPRYYQPDGVDAVVMRLAIPAPHTMLATDAASAAPGQTPADQTPAGQTPVDETPPDQTPADQPPAAQTPANQTPPDQTPADQTPANQTAADQTPANQTPPDQASADRIPAEGPTV